MTRHACGLDRTFCESCGNELEVGQVGSCESCAKGATSSKPWLTEPNFLRWRDELTGLTCAIVRHPVSLNLCGYVRVPRGPLHDKLTSFRRKRVDGVRFGGKAKGMRDVKRKPPMYEQPLVRSAKVHGGLTFGGKHYHYRLSRGIWLGFDCAHYLDVCPGFEDLMPAHFGEDGRVYRDFEYVKQQCVQLAQQLALCGAGS